MADKRRTSESLRELALFAGAGGGILGGKLLGWRTVCAVERDAYAAAVLAQRQNDGCLEPFPIWSDVETFDGRPWRGIVDVVSGGFPCQDISCAGKGAGIEGSRSGLWVQMARIIGEVRPRYVFVENSPMLTSRGLGTVLGDLSKMGFDARWGVVGAHNAGAPHLRDRIWVVGDSCGFGWNARRTHYRTNDGAVFNTDGEHAKDVSDPISKRLEREQQTWTAAIPDNGPSDGDNSGWWTTEPDVGRVAHGVAFAMDKYGGYPR